MADIISRPVQGMRSFTVTPTGGKTKTDPAVEKAPGQAAEAAAGDLTQPAKADFTDLRLMDTVVVKRVIDPLRIEIHTGKIYQLSSIDYPDFDAHDPGPQALVAQTRLKELLEGKQVRIYQTKASDFGRMTRMGYELAHMETQGDVWVQGLLIANGFARLFPSERNVEMADAMLALENEARTAKRGVWADAKNAAIAADDAGSAMGRLAIVEGTIRAAENVNNRLYLNFGSDWKKDFTIGVQATVRKALAAKNIQSSDLINKRVRIHGWVEEYNGPYIELTHPAWLEVLEDAP